MTIHVPWRPEAGAILQGSEAEVLTRIGASGCGAAIWQRRLDADLLNWLATLPDEALPNLRIAVAAGAVERAIHSECDRVGLPADPLRDRLASDIAALAVILAEITASPMLRLRLQPVSTNACRRFHIDRVHARLLCTYRGSGTQFAHEPEADPLLQMAPGEVALLRGTLWPGEEIPTVLHRSPPIEGSGEIRLLLVIDPVLAGEDEEEMH